MFDGAGPLSNEVVRKLPRDATLSCRDEEEPSGRKIGGLFYVRPDCHGTGEIIVTLQP
jgi:hypothetical protein